MKRHNAISSARAIWNGPGIATTRLLLCGTSVLFVLACGTDQVVFDDALVDVPNEARMPSSEGVPWHGGELTRWSITDTISSRAERGWSFEMSGLVDVQDADVVMFGYAGRGVEGTHGVALSGQDVMFCDVDASANTIDWDELGAPCNWLRATSVDRDPVGRGRAGDILVQHHGEVRARVRIIERPARPLDPEAPLDMPYDVVLAIEQRPSTTLPLATR